MSQKTRREKLKLLGLCTDCGQTEVMHNSHICEICTLKKAVRTHFKDKNTSWEDLAEVLIAQKHRCPYTGIHLQLGKNASLDHIIATGVGGEAKIDNVQWVHNWINMMKGTTEDEIFRQQLKEFIVACFFHLQSIRTDMICIQESGD